MKFWILLCIFCTLFISNINSRCHPRTKRQTRVVIGDSMPVQRTWQSQGRPVVAGQAGPIPLRVVGQSVSPGGGAQFVPVQSLVQTRTLADGTVVKDCWDSRTGVHEHGTDWKTWDLWKLSCDNGTISVLACVTTSGEEIPVGTTKTIDGFWHKCEETNQEIRYIQEPSCLINGKRLHVNETFKWGSFKRQCQETGYTIVGCYYFDSEGNEKELAIGETAEDGIIRHSCMREPTGNGSDRVRYQQSANGCKYDGETRKIGETWIARHKRFRCEEDGAVSITACVTDNGTEIDVGKFFVRDNIVHECYQVGNIIYYHAYPCGPVINVSCEPKHMSNQPQTAAKLNQNVGTRILAVNAPPFADSPLPAREIRIVEGPTKAMMQAQSVFGVGSSHVYREEMIC